MKHINFINPVPEKVHTATIRWIRLSKICIATLTILLLTINVRQLITIYALHNQQRETLLPPLENSLNDLEKKHKEVSLQHAKLTKKHAIPRTPLPLIKNVLTLAGSTVELTTIKIAPKKTYTIEGIALNINDVTAFATALNNSPHTIQTTISSLQPHADTSTERFQFTINGAYKLI